LTTGNEVTLEQVRGLMLLVDETYSRAVKALVDSGEAVDMAL